MSKAQADGGLGDASKQAVVWKLALCVVGSTIHETGDHRCQMKRLKDGIDLG